MKFTHLGLALAALSISLLAGCYRCGDGICDGFRHVESEYFESSGVPTVFLNSESDVHFEAPRALRRYRNYVVNKVYVYEDASRKTIWQIDSKTTPGEHIEVGPKYDPKTPISYGKLIDGTVLTIAPQKLEVGTTYNMRGYFIGYDQLSVPDFISVKVTFRLVNQDGRVTVEPLRTKIAY